MVTQLPETGFASVMLCLGHAAVVVEGLGGSFELCFLIRPVLACQRNWMNFTVDCLTQVVHTEKSSVLKHAHAGR